MRLPIDYLWSLSDEMPSSQDLVSLNLAECFTNDRFFSFGWERLTEGPWNNDVMDKKIGFGKFWTLFFFSLFGGKKGFIVIIEVFFLFFPLLVWMNVLIIRDRFTSVALSVQISGVFKFQLNYEFTLRWKVYQILLDV